MIYYKSLRASQSIDCPTPPSSICHSCIMGKQIKLPFFSSDSHSTMPFDIIHNDLWASSIFSPSGYKYYVLLLDNYTIFLWTFPLIRKS